MFKVSTSKLDNRGVDVDQDVPAEDLGLPEEGFSWTSPLKCRLHANRVNNGVLVQGTVEGKVETQCARCLEKFVYEISVPDFCFFQENPLPREIDLTPALREDIILSFPQNFICRDDCKGICVVCGKNRNREDCGCAPVFKENTPWSALDKLELE